MIPGVEELMRWNFPELPEDARIYSEFDDNEVLQITIYFRPEPDAPKQRVDLALELHLFGHGLANDMFNNVGYEEFLAERAVKEYTKSV